ncbi:next to BRCA1 gene 1 protein-like isoform X1 [Ostrinia furnacalis]|uniref:next to BRCA1 gene 1 protein-like isoform X1 n=1 Tax=Ostrinia furnacalis TaxID=93504 RepID=UPI00103C536C|nr:next to BRCA1 gene 1 protein-like isoform X1 [Ostrinia furnacalis]
MVNYCCVSGCSRNSRLNNHLTYYTFPKDVNRQEQWLRAVGREDLIDKGELKSGYRVCSRHFSPNSIKTQSKNLCPDAVPTLCLPPNEVNTIDPEPMQHDDIVCNSCHKPIRGFRYKCVSCDDYDLCPKCESMETHSNHYMLRIPKPLKFMIADQLIKKWKRFFKAEHVVPDCQDDCKDGILDANSDESDDDVPITKYVIRASQDSDLSEDVKSKIRNEIARVIALKSAEKRKKKEKAKGQTNGKKRSGVDLASSVKKPRPSDLVEDPVLPPPLLTPTHEVAFADVNEMCDVKTEVPAAMASTDTEFGQPLMHVRLSDDLTELMIEMAGEPKTVYRYTDS